MSTELERSCGRAAGPQVNAMDCTDFERYCGPVAIAAATGISRPRAARILLGVQRRRASVVAPACRLEDAVIALNMLGFAVSRFDTSSGQVRECAVQCVARARHTLPSEVPMMTAVNEIIAAAPIDEQGALWKFFDHRYQDRPTLRTWLRRPGVWLVIVQLPRSTHWIAVRDHAVIVAADELHSGAPVIDALRLDPVQPSGSEPPHG